MHTQSFQLIETDMHFVNGSMHTKSLRQRLPGSRQRLLCNSRISIFEEYLRTGNLESYSYTLEVDVPTWIDFQIFSPQIHLLYHMDGRKPVRYCQCQNNTEYLFSPKTGVFFYVPKTSFTLHFDPGKHHIQGFTLPRDLFNFSELAEFEHLAEIIAANMRELQHYKTSINFMASEHTRRILGELSAELKKNPLIPKISILGKIQNLLYLSKDKLLKASGRLRTPELMVLQARQLIYERITYTDEYVFIKDIAHSLNIQPTYLNNLHKKKFGVPISGYRNQEVLKKAKYCLDQQLSIKITTSSCGFVEQSSFINFFKKHTGLTPTRYLHASMQPKDSKKTSEL